MKSPASPYQICECTLALIAERGYDGFQFSEIAVRAGIDLDQLALHFGDKQDVILFHYQRINADWLLYVEELKEPDLATRFEMAMQRKLTLVEPHADALVNLMGGLMRASKIGVASGRTVHVRAMGLRVMHLLVDGARDGARLGKRVDHLPSLLYVMHWAILLMHLQGGAPEKAAATIGMAAKLLRQAKQVAFLLPLVSFLKDLGHWADALVDVAPPSEAGHTQEILKVIFNHRKTIASENECSAGNCATCFALHSPTIAYFVASKQPIHFILPAFPAKSPNPSKVLGKLPDLGEEIALVNLQGLCDEIKAVYPAGAFLTICSDGRIFSELVGVTEEDVTAYVLETRAMIARLGLQSLEILNLEDLLPAQSIDASKSYIMASFAEPLEDYQSKISQDGDFKALFNGMHRFIAEDRAAMDPAQSKSQVKADSKRIALEVIRHSNAWTRFIMQVYPAAVRLSIHPYPAHSPKIGIRLTKAADNWITPWHGVIALEADGYVLMKRGTAEQAGAQVVERHDRPYLMQLIQ
jgi:pyoverdine/dityrosine biosynthesis protein Dit1/AcrR family transcriptional regulator